MELWSKYGTPESSLCLLIGWRSLVHGDVEEVARSVGLSLEDVELQFWDRKWYYFEGEVEQKFYDQHDDMSACYPFPGKVGVSVVSVRKCSYQDTQTELEFSSH